jgi:AraC-like DNA-binding protein
MSSGDLIVIPHGTMHILSDTADRAPITLDEAFTQEKYDGQGIFQIGEGVSPHETQLVCGHFEFLERFTHPLITHLPDRIIKRENEGIDFNWMKDTLRFLSHTATTQHDGSSAIIKRLSEVIFIQAIRFWSTQSDAKKGFIAALSDQHLSTGLKAFHENYAADWTVEKLARESSMSRSLFSDRFKQYLDLSPMQYVTNWRMQSARQILLQSDLPLDGIAREIGYESAAAFSKAFKRTFNQNPGECRRLASH